MSLIGTTNAFGKDTWIPGAVGQYEAELGTMFPVVDANPDWRVEGRNIFFKLITGASLGSQIVTDGGDFAANSDASFGEGKLTMSRLAHTIELTYDEFELLNSNNAAAIPVMQGKMGLGVEQVTRDAIRMMWMDGTAALATCGVTTASLTVVLGNSTGDAGLTPGVQTDRDKWIWLSTGRARIDIVDATTGTAIANGSNRTIVDFTTGTSPVIVLDTAGGVVTTTSAHRIVWSGNVLGGGTYTSREFPGILAAVDTTGTYQNINRATAGNSFWKSAKVTGTTAGTNENISLANVLKLLHLIAQNGGKQPTPESHMACYNYGVQGSLLTYLAPAMRINDASLSGADLAPKGFQGGQSVLNIPGRPDIHAPRNNLFLLSRREKEQFQFVRPLNRKFSLMDFAPGPINGMWFPKPGATAGRYAAAYLGYLTGLLSLHTMKPNAHGRLTDITEQGTAY